MADRWRKTSNGPVRVPLSRPSIPSTMASRPGAHKSSLMQDRKGIALHQLRAEETELLARLNQVRKAICVLGESEANPGPKRPQCRADLLRKYLLDRPAGARVKDVPAILKAMGHGSFAAHETINWLSPSQLPPGKRYFIRKKGIITLRPEFNPAVREDLKSPTQVDPPPMSPTGDQQGSPPEMQCHTDKEHGASIEGVNRQCNSLVESALDGN